MRIGIDVGGTNTDAVLLGGTSIEAQAKCPTTADVTSGILQAVDQVLGQGPKDTRLQGVMLGTTHFTNALLEGKGLAPTAVLRLALPATQLLPPLVEWSDSLRDAIGGFVYLVHGGHEFDGREISALDRAAVQAAARDMRKKGVQAAAVCGVFSSVDPSHEEAAAEIIRNEAPHIQVTLSHEIGRIGLLERENAATLNACLAGLAVNTLEGVQEALKSLGLDCPLFITQNDGTLMDVEFASRYPVFTISSGATNSMRGAAFLSGVTNGVVVDIGGTSTDVGVLVNGYPREASVAVSICGVRTNFRMPDVLSIALGGGSIIVQDPLSIGPESVGYRLTDEALVFGGTILTTTDVSVAGGLSDIGSPNLVQGIEPRLANQALTMIRQKVEDTVDRVKFNSDDVPVVLVGGGSILIGDVLEGATEVIRPENAAVANAVGSAIAQVGGQVERVFSLDRMGRQEARNFARNEAIAKAVAAGADPNTVELVEIDEVPLTYLPSNVTRIRAKASGDLMPG